MLVVIQGPMKSGKTTLAYAIAQMADKQLVFMRQGEKIKSSLPNNIHIYDNLNPTREDVQVLHDTSKEFNIIVTTCIDWSEWTHDDYVIKMEAIRQGAMIRQDRILKYIESTSSRG